MGDNLTPEQRSYCMSCVKGRDTGLEIRVRSALHRKGLRFHKHVKDLPGKPDIVFRKAKVAIFVDGDFWHGYMFPLWENRMSDFWKMKIAKTRERDVNVQLVLREMGWNVIRLWQHELEEDFDGCIEKIISNVRGTEH